MKDLEKFIGLGSLKPTKEEKLHMRQLFEMQISTAALVSGKISLDRFREIIKKRVGINIENK
jgi:hypothetical protein